MTHVQVSYAGDVQHPRDVLNPAPRLRVFKDGEYAFAIDCLVSAPSLMEIPAADDLDVLRASLARFVAPRLADLMRTGLPHGQRQKPLLVAVTDREKVEGVDAVLPLAAFAEFIAAGDKEPLAAGSQLAEFEVELPDTTSQPTDDDLYTPFPPFSEFAGDINSEGWTRVESRLDTARDEAADGVNRSELDYLLRSAAVDTGAIEGLYDTDRGFTRTIAEATAWAPIISAQKGDDVAELIAAQLRAYELALDAATHAQPVVEALIRRLHEEACAAQSTYRVMTPLGYQDRPLPKGSYKADPNHVELPDGSVHAYAPVLDTPPEMARLVSELQTPTFVSAHPVMQAAYAHHALTVVHPFADGNGRVARLLASIFLLRSSSIPFVLFADEKGRYFDALSAADSGRFPEWTNFVFEKAIETMNTLVELLRLAASTPVGDAAERLRGVLTGQGGLTHDEIEETARALEQGIAGIAQEAVGKLDLPPGVSVTVGLGTDLTASREGFRQGVRDGPRDVQLAGRTSAPAEAQAVMRVRVLIGTTRDGPAFRIERPDEVDGIEVILREAYPTMAEGLRLRIGMMLDRTLGELLTELSESADQSLRSKGYR